MDEVQAKRRCELGYDQRKDPNEILKDHSGYKDRYHIFEAATYSISP